MRRQWMRNASVVSSSLVLAAMAATSVGASGCERELSSKKTTTVEKDGTVETEEERVVEKPDGSITKEEKKQKIDPPN